MFGVWRSLTVFYILQYMKILGVKPVTNFLVWFLDNFIILIISSAAITIILKAGHILPNSNGFIVFLYFVDFGASVISLGYLISAFFSHANTAALSACLLYIITFFPYMVFVVVQNQLNFSSQILIVSSARHFVTPCTFLQLSLK